MAQRLKQKKGILLAKMQQELIKLTDIVTTECGIPRRVFKTPAEQEEKRLISFCVSNVEDLEFESFYGDLGPLPYLPDMKFFAVNNSHPQSLNYDEINRSVIECIDSIKEDDKEFATLSLCLSKVFFAVNKDVDLSDKKCLLSKFGKPNSTSGHVYAQSQPGYPWSPPIRSSCVACEWKSPRKVRELLQKEGFEFISREQTDPELTITLRGRFLNHKRLHYNNDLILDHSSLKAKSWRVRHCFPYFAYLLHGIPSGNDLIIRSCIARHVSFEEILNRNPNHSPTWKEPGLNNLLQRTNVGFRLLKKNSGVGHITESLKGEKILFRFMGVDFTVIFNNVKYYFHVAKDDEFILTDDLSYRAKIDVSMTTNRDNLIKAITHLAKILFKIENDSTLLELTTSPHYVTEEDGTRVPAVDIHSILRLRNEETVHNILGLSNDASVAECERKYEEIEAIITRSRKQRWVINMNINLVELEAKLRRAFLKE